MSLSEWGYESVDRAAFAALSRPDLLPARVVDERRERWRVVLEEGEALAELSGRLRHEAFDAAARPAVGDFVAVATRPSEGRATIHAVLPRRSVLARKEAGRGSAAQLLAANVDAVLLAVGLDGDWNARRLERYVAFAWESGAQPLVVLTKADLHTDLTAVRGETEALAPGVPVVTVSARTGAGLAALAEHLPPRRTAALVGSSGVGKSTLLNALLGADVQAVNDLRARDARGQHTTTQRSLFALPGGALLVDTPGLRELGLLADDESVAAAFAEIEALAAGCRFRDCTHGSEPGCAVLAAVTAGSLPAERLEAFHRLAREAAWQRRKSDPLARQAEERRWRAIQRSVRRNLRGRGRG
jgi:ribosome biogenesis GTPase / thiamine phosphate phosphatase